MTGHSELLYKQGSATSNSAENSIYMNKAKKNAVSYSNNDYREIKILQSNTPTTHKLAQFESEDDKEDSVRIPTKDSRQSTEKSMS